MTKLNEFINEGELVNEGSNLKTSGPDWRKENNPENLHRE
jgi:hypothetical protein